MIYGVDVSSFQGAYPWASGETFGFAKATEGTFYLDPQFQHNWDTMWSKRILRGAYHFAHPGTPALAQASYFVDFVKKHGLDKSDALAVDLEVTDGLKPAAVAAWAVAFVAEVERRAGKSVWIYTTKDFIRDGCCEGLYKHPLWIADPGTQPGDVTGSISPWKVWAVHQYEWGAPGSPDKDVLNGDPAVWDALVNLVPAVTYKSVTASWACEGTSSLKTLCDGGFGGTAWPGTGASTVIRMTLDNSHDQVFATDLAQYISAGDLIHAPVPKGVVLYYPKRVKV